MNIVNAQGFRPSDGLGTSCARGPHGLNMQVLAILRFDEVRIAGTV
jgi:hypothetical protein